MAKASHNKDKKPSESAIDLEIIIKDMRRNFTRYMTKLGAHITRLTVFEANKISRTAIKTFNFIKLKAMPKILKVGCVFTSFSDKARHSFNETRNYFYNLDDNVSDTRVNHGFFPATKLFFSTIGKSIWESKRGLVTLFNWTAPVVSIVFLVNVVGYATNLNYGVSVEYNGQKLGVISKESEYDEAEMALQQKITYVEGNEKVVITPKLSVQVVKDSKEIVKPNQLADKMIVNADAELTKAYGLYIDGNFMGAVVDRTPIMNTLSNILANYQSSDVKSINFQKNVEYKDGLYLKASIVDPSKIISTLTSDSQVEAYYTIQASDTPIKIAAKNGISMNELVALNPNIENDCKLGEQVLLNRSEPFMPVQVVKDVQYTDKLDYKTEKTETASLYKGNEKVVTKGQEGEASVTAEVTYMNGYEVGRTIVNTVVTKQPVTEKISVGTKDPQPTKGTTITGNGKYAWPVAGGYISAYMGDGRGHKGIDIAAPKGTSIFAAEAGTVILAQKYYGYGNCVMIQHADGNVTLYGHQSKILVKNGQKVQKGELIGLVGSTGDSSGNHCHFEVRQNGKVVNPLNYVK